MRRKINKARSEETRMHPNGKQVFKMLAENMCLLGYDGPDPLVYYTKSENQNIWNYYKLVDPQFDDQGKEIQIRYCWDARRHCPDHEFESSKNPVDIIKDVLFQCEHKTITPELFYQKPSELVQEQDKIYGEVALTFQYTPKKERQPKPKQKRKVNLQPKKEIVNGD
jgi:hypothetical protein